MRRVDHHCPIVLSYSMRIYRGGILRFINAGRYPLKSHEATKPAFNVWPSLAKDIVKIGPL